MSPFNIHCYLCFTIIFAVYSTWKIRCSTTSGILYMPTTLSLLENVRECLKYLYMLTIHLLGNSNNFCSIICEMHLIDVSNFSGLESAWLLQPLADYETGGAQAILNDLMWYGLNDAVEELFQELLQWSLLSITEQLCETVFGTQLPEASPSQEKVVQFALQIKCTLQISMQRFLAVAI